MKKNYGIFVLAAIGLLNFAPLTPVFAAEVPAIGSIACEADSFLGNDEAYPVEAVEAASTAITPDTQPAPVNPGTTTPDTQPAPINPGTTTPDTQPAPINPGTTTPDTQP
ncbi:MAG: hypothetical protein LBT44_09435, partial [Clostridiales bacterium]|nr:hypothetical protein [Clostridiales bacterium]